MSADLLIARVIHILAAAVWIGGTVFLVTVAVPFARSFGEQRRTEIASEIGRRFRPVAWTALIGLLLSGLYTMHRFGLLSWTALQGSEYGKALLVKVGLAAGVLILAMLHDYVLGPRVERGQTSRRPLLLLARANAVLALLVLVLGVVLAH